MGPRSTSQSVQYRRLGESGRFPLSYDCISLALKFHERVKNLTDNSLVSLAYQEQQRCKLDWYTNLNGIITNNKSSTCPLVTHNYTMNNSEPYEIKNIFFNLKNNFIQHWAHSKSNTSKLTFYDNVKSDFDQESYLNDVTNFTARSALTKLRISAHDLKIETGRYSLLPREERSCEWCKLVTSTNYIENENHVLLECDLYASLRSEFLTFARSANTSCANVTANSATHDVSKLFNPLHKNAKYNDRLAKTISKMFKTREKCIEELNKSNST